MELQELLNELADILEEDDLPEDFLLKECEYWDSLAKLSLATFLEEKEGIFLEDDDYSGFETPNEIFDKIKELSDK